MENIKTNIKLFDNGTGDLLIEGQDSILYSDSTPVTIHIPSVDSWTITDLRYTCRRNKVKGYTAMDREQLIEEVKKVINKFKKEVD